MRDPTSCSSRRFPCLSPRHLSGFPQMGISLQRRLLHQLLHTHSYSLGWGDSPSQWQYNCYNHCSRANTTIHPAHSDRVPPQHQRVHTFWVSHWECNSGSHSTGIPTVCHLSYRQQKLLHRAIHWRDLHTNPPGL